MNIFETLYIAWKRERETINLTPLEKEFYVKIKPYVNHLEAQYKSEEDEIVSSLFEKRWNRVNYIINDLIHLRLTKHFRDAISETALPEPLPYEEKDFRDKINLDQANFKEKVLNLNQHQYSEPEDDISEYQYIIFNKPEEKVSIGSDFNSYGPYNIDDIVLMPKDNVRNYLIKSKGSDIKIDKI